MGRIIGIDFGSKRTGIAVTDPCKMIAWGLETVASDTVIEWLEGYISREKVERIVVGRPLMLDGSESETMKNYVQPFINKLKKKFPDTMIVTFDERYTSKMAVRAMIDGGMKKKDRRNKATIDKISATILLQEYLIEETYKNSVRHAELVSISPENKEIAGKARNDART